MADPSEFQTNLNQKFIENIH